VEGEGHISGTGIPPERIKKKQVGLPREFGSRSELRVRKNKNDRKRPREFSQKNQQEAGVQVE